MKRFWVAGIASVALIAATGGMGQAADLPVKAPAAVPVAAPVVNWSGFYIGGHAGVAWSRDIFDFDIEDPDCAFSCETFRFSPAERTLIYIRAAYATARIGVHAVEGLLNTSDTAPGITGDWRGWRSGWNMGAGIEYMPLPNLVLGVEFNFYNFAFDTKQPILFSDGVRVVAAKY